MVNINDFAGNYVLDQGHSEIGFVARHAMITKVRGEFTDYDADFTVDENGDHSLRAVIKSDSVTTGSADRDGHLKSADFFDVGNYPEITFVAKNSTFVAQHGVVTGELTIKGITKVVDLDVEVFGQETDPFGNVRLGFEANTEINRKDFNIDWNAPLNTGGVLVSEKITINIEGSAIKQ